MISISFFNLTLLATFHPRGKEALSPQVLTAKHVSSKKSVHVAMARWGPGVAWMVGFSADFMARGK
ncbi:MAG TPA: hypothetical protein VGX70_10235 [Gemmataceae bacterium]|nr:hypothetical protein [Gemmataceae bacterium]